MGAVANKKSTEIQSYSPKEGAAKIHISDAAVKAAERAKDASAFESAIRKNLEAKHDFAAHYKASFPHGVRSDSSVGSGVSAEIYCTQFGFVQRTVQRWCEKLLPDGGLDRVVAERLKAAEKRFVNDTEAANYSSAEIEWYTPGKYVEAAREVLGGIDLDPASCEIANQTVQAAQIFTINEDALSQKWHGSVFMNPPYGVKDRESVAGMFCMKAIEEYAVGNVDAAIILVNSAHAQKWQKPLYDYPVCFVDHRIAFVSSDGQVNKAPTFMNIFVYLGSEVEKFAEVFSQFGYVMAKVQ